jgi:N-acetylglucosamine-6-sulfatase
LDASYLRAFSPLRAVGALTASLLLLSLALCLTGDESVSAQEGGAASPNIVFVLADDMRADDLEHMPRTRGLLVEQGITFPNAFVTYSMCCPSRATILRGQYAHNHLVLDGDPPHGGFERFRGRGLERSTVATWLSEGGYRTVLLGKYLNGYGSAYIPPGWDDWYAQVGGGYYDYKINENGRLVPYGDDKNDYYTDVLAAEARSYINRAADRRSPFFMYLAPRTPHVPLVPAPRHEDATVDADLPRPPSFGEADVTDKPSWVRRLPTLESETRQKVGAAYRERLRMLLSLDGMVADIVEELRATGELENTYIFFTSDNGFHLGEHRIALRKRTPYEEAHRVPLVVRGPGVPAGHAVDEMTLNTDFAPTFADLAGVSAPPFVDGRSLEPMLDGAPPESWRASILLESWRERIARRGASTYYGIRTEDHKYVEHASGERELYDLRDDPYELRSLHESADPVLVGNLKSRLEALSGCARQSCRDAEDVR